MTEENMFLNTVKCWCECSIWQRGSAPQISTIIKDSTASWVSSDAEARLTILCWPSRLNCFIYLPFKREYDQCQQWIPAAEVSRMSNTVFLPVRGCWKLTQKCDLHIVLSLWWFGQKYHQARLWIWVLFRLRLADSFAPAAEKTRQQDIIFCLPTFRCGYKVEALKRGLMVTVGFNNV